MRPATEATALAVLVGVLLTGCDGTPPAADPATAPSVSPSPEGTAASPDLERPAARLPARPPRDARALARYLTTAYEVLVDPGSADGDVRRAAELEQLAARELATGPSAYAAQVLRRLDPPVRTRTRAHVRAATLLGAMTAPQPALPDWRVVRPPPPGELRGHYRRAERALGVRWEYLAAIHLVETRMGRIRGVSTAGAQGPMQFLPTTWDLYGEGGDIHDVGDAVMAAARLLLAHGAPGDMSRALWHYNPSDRYVEAVELYAAQLRSAPRTYRGYWHWRVLYKHVDGTMVLEEGYPRRPAVPLR